MRQSACAAHTNGKRFVEAEGPTSIGPHWERSPRDLKGLIDRIFCSGVNRLVWHTFTTSPGEYGKPGIEYFAGTHLNPNVTWWEQAGDFVGYIGRCSYLLQQGLFVADALYYNGDDVPNMVFLKEEVTDLGPGYDWDKCSKDVILNRLSVSYTHLDVYKRQLLCRNRFRQMAEPRSVKIHRLKINLSACRFENKGQFCNTEKTVPDARPAVACRSAGTANFLDGIRIPNPNRYEC